MDRAGAASHSITTQWGRLTEVFERDVDGLIAEHVSLLLLLTQEEKIHLNEAENPQERTDKLLHLILQKGEAACQTFLHQLENMVPRFPMLSDLSGLFLGNKIKTFMELVLQLKMTQYTASKLTLRDVLSIGPENLKEVGPEAVEVVPWHFLRKLFALNRTARHTSLGNPEQDLSVDFDSVDESDTSNSSHPLDVLCALLHCSDSFLQQEIVSKMTMCQFAVPLLLPAGDGPDCTLMLWAMRDIVKRWRPQSLAESKGFREDSLVHIPMPTFSFVRLGKSKLSKSKILNQVLSPAEQHHDFFIHDNMEGGNVPRKISDGLVEISWYFPGGRKDSDIFPEPIAVTNLRGDLESNWKQFSFLTQVSSAVFVFAESVCEREYNMLSRCSNQETKYYFIISPSFGKRVNKETKEFLEKLFPVLKLDKTNVLIKNSTSNEAEMVKKIHFVIAHFLKNSSKKVKMEDMSNTIIELGIRIDESSEECQKAKGWAIEVTRGITDVVSYKKETMRLQGDLWKQLAQIEKEFCRMRKQGSVNGEEYKSQLVKQRLELHRKQYRHDLPNGMISFIAAITDLSQVEKHYFLKWMKFDLDTNARKNLSALQDEYKEKCNKCSTNVTELKELDQRISDSSLGIEHFLRELGQFYESECSMVREGEIQGNERLFTRLPGAAADLLLDGFPLELIDGDASNIPLQWVTDVLTELDNKTRGRCRMRVITVLGVQSTGKSTLLNTMFGLQFPVASGRCTRGAFMTLIKVKENFQEELGCDFILVIDTEGLKAPELASLDHSYEHDNELATLVVGLSDITIVNMAMENTTEMRDILQIVVHAFLRMDKVGKKPNCQFVHQNVSDVSAHDKNMRDRKKLLEQLNEMTKVAARMEDKSNVTQFSDIMQYDLDKHSWYIPGLWHGVPPMASVNSGYSENIFEFKKYLFEFMKTQLMSRSPQNIRDFIEWIKSLWHAVKHEKFIFSFRNSLVAEAYNQLSVKYSQLEWDFRKKVQNGMMETENIIMNQPAGQLQTEMYAKLKCDINNVLQKEEKIISDSLETYFESGSENVHLIERYREDFFRSAKLLRDELEDYLGNKFEEVIRIQEGKQEIQSIQDSYLTTIEEKVSRLLETCRTENLQLDDEKLESEFNTMWNETLKGLQLRSLNTRDISQEMLQQLRKELRHKAGSIVEKINDVNSFTKYGHMRFDFEMNEKYMQIGFIAKIVERYRSEYWNKINDLALSILDKCQRSVKDNVNKKGDYNKTYCQELLNIINERLREADVRKLNTAPLFELDLKLLGLVRAAPMFQKMHDDFIQENDPKLCLEKLKPKYFSTFKCIYQKKDESQRRAQSFCDTCLKPALSEYMYRNLGKDIVDDILHSGDSVRYGSRTFFQFSLLKELLEDEIFTQYVEYSNQYESFVRKWILKHIEKKYKESTGLETLQSNILSSITKKVREVLKDPKVQRSPNVSSCLEIFCAMLEKDLVISQNDMKVIIFKNTANVQQFSAQIESFLCDTKEQILSEIKYRSIEFVLFKVTLKPEDELFKKVFGCGKQCPFCEVPCEAGGADHKEHFASVHRPQGLGSCRDLETNVLCHDICSTCVIGNGSFLNTDTGGKLHPFKDYRTYYPDWAIQPDGSINASDYWKFVFNEFNGEFAKEYNAKPAEIPQDWNRITEEQALQSLKETFNIQ
ncbi:interferon-induced very large GTPase 1-like [Ascaphus truei]|uniref:interferon-induced very large GTPase 1-like n=1 Tax=Ascaphus truei TaxID=8439 RepID=UPI003F5A26F9